MADQNTDQSWQEVETWCRSVLETLERIRDDLKEFGRNLAWVDAEILKAELKLSEIKASRMKAAERHKSTAGWVSASLPLIHDDPRITQLSGALLSWRESERLCLTFLETCARLSSDERELGSEAFGLRIEDIDAAWITGEVALASFRLGVKEVKDRLGTEWEQCWLKQLSPLQIRAFESLLAKNKVKNNRDERKAAVSNDARVSSSPPKETLKPSTPSVAAPVVSLPKPGWAVAVLCWTGTCGLAAVMLKRSARNRRENMEDNLYSAALYDLFKENAAPPLLIALTANQCLPSSVLNGLIAPVAMMLVMFCLNRNRQLRGTK